MPTPAPAPAPVSEPELAATQMPQRVTPDPAPTPPQPPRPPREDQASGSSNRKFIIPAAIVGGIAVVGVVAALALGGGGGDEPPAPTPEPTAEVETGGSIPVSAAGIALKVPTGWSDAGEPLEVPGLESPTALGGPKGASIAFGMADETAANSTLLPGDLRADEVPQKQIADLSEGIQAARYDGLKIGDKTATVFAIPTTEGVATLACAADAEVCSTIASSLRITEGKAFPVGPSADYAKDVERALARLERTEKSAARELKNAGRRATQVAATTRLATAYTRRGQDAERARRQPR